MHIICIILIEKLTHFYKMHFYVRFHYAFEQRIQDKGKMQKFYAYGRNNQYKSKAEEK